MSINTTFVFAPDTDVAAIPGVTGAPASFDDVASPVRAAQFGPHAVLVDDEASRLSLPDGSVIVTLGGTADVYAVEVPSVGRLRVLSEREVVEDVGDPVAAEGIFDEIEDPEDAHIEFVCRLAGITPRDLWDGEWFAVETR